MRGKDERVPFDMNTTSIDAIAKQIALVYKSVRLMRSPLARWLNIINDMTILDEDIRRENRESALDRAGRILMRILSFVGHYLYTHTFKGRSNVTAADLVARTLRAVDFREYFGSRGPSEGPSRWIYAKYPNACAKCGCKPCECLLRPWIFEERRDNPEEYMRLRKKAERKRVDLRRRKCRQFTLPHLLAFFKEVYYNHYYREDIWKLTMHLNEELGEATTELARIEFALQARNDRRLNLGRVLEKTEKQTREVLDKRIWRIEDKELKERIKREFTSQCDELFSKFKRAKPFVWRHTIQSIGLRFKDEIADIFSWLSAIINKLSGTNIEATLGTILDRYLYKEGDLHYFKCAWCGKKQCEDYCLPSHEISEELVERIVKF